MIGGNVMEQKGMLERNAEITPEQIEQFAESSGAMQQLDDVLDEQYDKFGNFEYYPPESPIIDPTDDEIEAFSQQFSVAVLREQYGEQREQIREGLSEMIDSMRSVDAPVQISTDYPVDITEEDIDKVLIAMLEDSLDERESENFAGTVAEDVAVVSVGEEQGGGLEQDIT